MAWHGTRPGLPQLVVPRPSWHDEPPVPDPSTVNRPPGWWAVLALDTAVTLHWLTEMQLDYVKAIGIEVLAVTASRSLALQKIGMVSMQRGLTAARPLDLQGIYMTGMSLNAALQRAMTLDAVGVASFPTALDLAPTLGLLSVKAIDVPAAWVATPSLAMTGVRLIDVSNALVLSRSLTLGTIQTLAVNQTIALSSPLAFGYPPTAETTAPYTGTSNINGYDFTHTIERWCEWMDLVALGAGGSGQASATLFAYGQPGRPGEWATATVRRGVDVPVDILVVTGTTGTGGPAIGYSAIPGFPGSATTITIAGVGTLTGPGGAGGLGFAANGSTATRGLAPSPQNLTYNGKVYAGGGPSTANNQPGKPPGGSGCGSPQLSGSQAGARGGAWVRSYQ